MSIETIALWHKRARPEPTEKNLEVQLGCHIEEFIEMLDTVSLAGPDNIDFEQMMKSLDAFATGLKNNTFEIQIDDRKEFLDAMADQIVTAIGVAHCAKMDAVSALEEVSRSNWSKYDDQGQPIFNENGKIMKGPNYTPPNLEGMY